MGRFEYLVAGKPVSWLIEHEYLADYRLFSIPSADMSGVHSRMGDFIKAESAAVMDNNEIIGDIVRHWKEKAADKLTIGFAVTGSTLKAYR